jgi:methylated-DNA-[protein]-cysteine S-methyltransferase
MDYCIVPSPVGNLLVAGEGDVLRAISFEAGRRPVRPEPEWERREAPFREVRRQLSLYFAGKLREFELRLETGGTPFQREVWTALQGIPYGETTSYGVLAKSIGKPAATRAVGAANGQNPIPIVIPCHRVIGANGSLTGFGGGLGVKETLLTLERGQLSLPRA